ncbi:uncharacterized protein YcfL [Clostridium acetobutylicum]|uniref:Cellulosome integrating cohesin-containing protein, secreted n=1 Tax=Clostridium acetobutylicum (strain ATCC 824 / DSM 792 / JCM 1419 / IAM 19013 / LMG 5710 / NBRC 13948 / NRRL B-527 / VKM B-1787 / 2291 / W) TaxID=272562 RepID=Q97KK4_CLOAB|nr:MULTISPECIES: cohesin domain-containing protein [Clostridium]AAK78890.1 Cellulosome integrating cohesin-containing protein, secreted [Clostridium acetobutylicum ATCC 824]ADZ19965.1 Cellulosome integrating cohesin-containing protein, secreted [Clostridium acetobutylicum EA 2018]AEI33992.1 cellulosome integrating cohesin-containing protein, secreted [Clostridium acetobutylicum DSM 1731]AWV80609.1 hypothetical protein DK921_10970 [Clostridium acetobutylicum]KHD35934.1 hypothetical protein NL50
MKKKGIITAVILSLLVIGTVGCKSNDTKSTVSANLVSSEKSNLKISSSSGKTGSNVEVKVKASNVAKKNVICCDFKIKYDASKLDVSGISPGEILKDPKDNLEYNVDSKNGVITILYSYSDKNIGKELISKNGDFVTLNLKIKDDAKKGKTQISFNGNPEFYDKNQKGVSVTTNKGEIEIK